MTITGMGGSSLCLDTVFAEERSGSDEHTAVQLCMNLGRKLEDVDKDIIDRAMREMMKELHARSALLNPDNIRWKKEWIAKAIECFKLAGLDPLSIQEIPNEYCGPLCCPHRVWLLVNTLHGTFKVGWRKRVIDLDWSKMNNPKDYRKLFGKEDVTQGASYIHCWSYEKLVEYLKALISKP